MFCKFYILLSVYYFCYNSLNRLGYIPLNGSIIGEWWTGKDEKVKGCWLIEVLAWNLFSRTEDNHKSISLVANDWPRSKQGIFWKLMYCTGITLIHLFLGCYLVTYS